METSMAMLLEPKVFLVPLLINMFVSTLMGIFANTKYRLRDEQRQSIYKLLVMALAIASAYYHSLHHELITESLYMDMAVWIILSVIIYDYGYDKIAKAFEEKVIGRILGVMGVKKDG